MKTKLHDLLNFPCLFTYKVIGAAKIELINKIIEIVKYYIPSDYKLSVNISNKGNFYSVSITITATNIKQIEKLYEELYNIDLVRIVL
ncbi:MAG: DUF493 family protein YbeD [Arsenophonus endosymbiont of Ceratovacuna japonica]